MLSARIRKPELLRRGARGRRRPTTHAPPEHSELLLQERLPLQTKETHGYAKHGVHDFLDKRLNSRMASALTKETHGYARHGVEDRGYHAKVDYRPSEQWHEDDNERGRSGLCDDYELDKPPSPKMERPASARSVKEYYKPSRNAPRGPRGSTRRILTEPPNELIGNLQGNRRKRKNPTKTSQGERKMKEKKHVKIFVISVLSNLLQLVAKSSNPNTRAFETIKYLLFLGWFRSDLRAHNQDSTIKQVVNQMRRYLIPCCIHIYVKLKHNGNKIYD
ncbi:hypothetical protein CEXT_65111 [Caerostris extrusa]|uniref:Uncharacterized protein n=1 Tax=Caerostris extrusa TaxID=172846 RepID=A0AAV4SX41_CAEEX|nr:hypothetical protein CEXT_65111 [Caerostris extrusa]